jgi:hypothetical protein
MTASGVSITGVVAFNCSPMGFNALDAGAILTFSLLRRRLQWQALIRSKLMNSWRIGATA